MSDVGIMSFSCFYYIVLKSSKGSSKCLYCYRVKYKALKKIFLN